MTSPENIANGVPVQREVIVTVKKESIGSFKLDGLVPAVFTPMTKDGAVDYDKFEMYCNHLTSKGMSQIYVNGTTGEGFSLTLDEREKIVEKWIEVGKKRYVKILKKLNTITMNLFKGIVMITSATRMVLNGKIKSIVVQVGALNLHDTKTMAEHAVKVGADAIATVPPLFFKPKTVDYLVKYCKEVASAAPNLPFYFYHLPGATGVELCIEDFLKVAAKEIPSLVGVKFSSTDLVDFIGCVHVPAPNRDDGKFNMMFGYDQIIMAGKILGADGGVGTSFNFMAYVSRKVLDSKDKGDSIEARLYQYRTQQTCKVVYKYGDLLGGSVAAFKALMTLIDVDLGPARSPMRCPTDQELVEIRSELQNIGFFDWYD
ncbi:N-acetylneuraminate lyase-like [Ruditapes philippinarum]|uniref:N-acetylneuraminate lyase-like n=1 Tax=Ruditapes philippinarum TaxID=129788 RepID=UPI00295BC2C2|nr:N-acetylneuraminate lyase-like [Ruditapes philippinarum]